jgi:nicotinamide mononucleotide transporter
MKLKGIFSTLTKFELGLWLSSLAVIISTAFISGDNLFALAASVVGATALIFVAKGNVFGQILTVVFSLMYGIISIGYRYYGEMITYLFMTAPMALLAVFTWLKHPSDKGKSEVLIAKLTRKRIILMVVFSVITTVAFYFILKWLGNANLIVSTISITTSFLASYLTYCRSPYYALAYAANDIVLIILWVAASFADIGYISMVACFIIFLINDIYGFVNWRRMMARQKKSSDALAA